MSISSELLLLCIDMQPIFLGAMPEPATVQRRCAFAVAAATGLGLETFFTEQMPQKLGATVPELLQLVPSPKVYGKSAFSVLADESTRAAIEARGTKHLLLTGIETSVCVYQTTVDALAAGMQVTLLSDCLAARRPYDAAICLQELRQAGAHVLPSETVFYSLLRDAKHPFFRAYTQLVKAHA